MTSLSIVQPYEDFALNTMVKMTDDARQNLEDLEEVYGEATRKISSWTKIDRPTAYALKTGRKQTISLKDAAIINARAEREIFKLDLKLVSSISVSKAATALLNNQEFQLNFSEISREIGIRGVRKILSGVKKGDAKGIKIESAQAIDNYFNRNFNTNLFNIENLFTETMKYLQSSLQNISPSIKNSEPAKGTKRLPEPTETNLENQSKRRRISTEDDQAEQSFNTTPPSVMEKNQFFINLEKQLSHHPLNDWNTFNVAQALIWRTNE